jgi:hypothetical protein
LGLAAAAVCAREPPPAAQDGSRGDYSLLIIIDRHTAAGRAQAEDLRDDSDPAVFWRVLWDSEMTLILLCSGGVLWG